MNKAKTLLIPIHVAAFGLTCFFAMGANYPQVKQESVKQDSKPSAAVKSTTGQAAEPSSKDTAASSEHLLDGTSMKYYYQNGSGIHIELYDGKLKYEWIVGPRKGHGNKDLEYRSRKIGDRMYVINWLEESHPDFMTLIFNFNSNVMYSSGILRIGTDNQHIVFDGGIIEDLILQEK